MLRSQFTGKVCAQWNIPISELTKNCDESSDFVVNPEGYALGRALGELEPLPAASTEFWVIN